MESDNYRGPYSMVNLMVTEKDFIKYGQSISKALNASEIPVKPKHLRSTVIGTFREQGATTFWSVALRQPYLDDRIVAWKLCYVLHKILREGHPLCLVHSVRHKKDIDEMGNLWRHLRGSYSQLIRLYSNLLLTKIDFHDKNPRFPGNLVLTDEELESIASDDLNNYFQLAVECFDYLDRILDLQSAIFGPISITQFNSESVSLADQCLIAPIVLCVQDASKLYDYCVKMMFKLHISVSSDVITGHRERFLKVFNELKVFYKRTNSMSYLRNLITVSPLPEDPPDFLEESEFYAYVTQEVTVPEERSEREELVNSSVTPSDYELNASKTEERLHETRKPSDDIKLIDISEGGHEGNPFQFNEDFLHSLKYFPSAPIYEKIDIANNGKQNAELLDELKRLRVELDIAIEENHKNSERIIALETALAEKDKELLKERHMRNILEQSVGGPGNDLYAKLRVDYVNLLMKNAELQKQVQVLDMKLAEKESESEI